MPDALPLVVLTRPQAASDRFAAQLLARFQVRVLIAPLQEIVFLPQEPVGEDIKGLIFTSQNGVLAWNRLENRPNLPAFCVGPQTTALARDMGLQATNCGGDAQAVIDTIMALRPAAPLLHMRGEHGRGRIAERLTAAGIETVERVTYRQVERAPSADLIAALDDPQAIVPLFSPRSAALFQKALPQGARPQLAVISQAVADSLDAALQHRMIRARTPDAEGMLSAIGICLGARTAP